MISLLLSRRIEENPQNGYNDSPDKGSKNDKIDELSGINC